MVKWLRWYRYEVVLHRMESGSVTTFGFIRFRTEREADRWVQKMNQTHHLEDQTPLTMWDYRRIG